MKKVICDICGKVIESPTHMRCTIEQLYTLSQRNIWTTSLDLCSDCQHEVDIWLNGDNKEDSLEKQEPTQEARYKEEEK